MGFQQDRCVSWGMTGGLDHADVGQNFDIVLNRTQPFAEKPDRLKRRRTMWTGSRRSGGI